MEKQLPKNWVETELGEITTKPQYGWTSKAGNEGEIKYLRTTDLSKGKVNWETVPYCIEIPDDISKYQVEKNDILISRAGSVGFSHRIENAPERAVFASYLIRFKPLLVNPKLIEFYLNSAEYWNSISDVSAGIAVQNINAPKLSGLKFPLPPLAEQNRIVEKLDALFAQLETIKTSMAKVPLLLKDFRQQVLNQAVTGKLTEDFIYYNQLKEIVDDRIKWYNSELENAKKGNLKKPKKIITHFDGNVNYLKDRLIKNVDITFFDEVAAKKENALKAGPFGSSLKKEFYVENGYKIYGQEQVINDDPNFGDYYINEAKYNELKSCEVSENDILISLVGTIGKVLVIPKGFQKGIINPRLVKLSLHEKVHPFYIKYYLQSQIVVDFLKENSHGGTMDVLNLGIIKSLPIPLPSFEEQLEIVSRVESLFAKADAIEKQYETLKAKIESLPQAILHKAFKGELTEQLDSDGDARELLREIEGLKEAGKTLKSKKTKSVAKKV